jgi:hypothetical protein
LKGRLTETVDIVKLWDMYYVQAHRWCFIRWISAFDRSNFRCAASTHDSPNVSSPRR